MAALAASSGGNLSADLPSLWLDACRLPRRLDWVRSARWRMLVGGVYLIIRRVISPIIPAAYIGHGRRLDAAHAWAG